jgi:hypothetical protein
MEDHATEWSGACSHHIKEQCFMNQEPLLLEYEIFIINLGEGSDTSSNDSELEVKSTDSSFIIYVWNRSIGMTYS